MRRPDKIAWLITAPLLAFAILLTLPVVLSSHARDIGHDIEYAPIYVVLLLLAGYAPLRLEVRRQGMLVRMNEVPLILALFYLSGPMVLVVRLVAAIIAQFSSRAFSPHKAAFNIAGLAAGVACANLVVFRFGLGQGGDPRTWLVLGLAIVVGDLVTFAAVVGVIALVQGPSHVPQFLRNAAPGHLVMGVNTVLGLAMLLTLQASKWASVLLMVLAVVLGFVYRAYAQFLRQHKSLSEMYSLTRAVGATNHDGTLPDVLLSRVRALMQAESATLWLPAHGRHPEMLLSSRLDYPGLLDTAPTPDVLRHLAMRTADTVAVGPKVGSDELRGALRDSGVKDVIVVPLSSGAVAIGTLEVAGRLGEHTAFGAEDLRLVETLSAHVGVAVENTRLVDRLQFDANHDALTGLANRRRMLEALGEAMTGSGPREVVAVLLFDVVALRQVNDSLGHAAGDKVLVEVANRLRNLAPQGALVARVGGDEFAVELRTASADAACAVAATLRAGLRDRMVIETLTVDVDTNVGVSIYPDHGAEPEVLLQRADVATHVAKSRGAVQLFNAGLESRSVRRVGLAGELRAALASGDLEVYFQPKVSLRDRRLVGVECLAHWEHPVHGSVPPLDFVAVAEHTGLLGRLNAIVLREGLRRAREWEDAGHSLSVSVNLSQRTLTDSDFPLQVSELLGEYGVAPERLILEISEIGLITGDQPMPVLERLCDLGVRLSIDDFGAGQSSFAKLHGLPVHEVKIDRTFVQGMATSPGDLAIVRTIVDMARHFEFDVVAEGVESELTLGLLEDMNCGMGQGFLFSRPLPYERFESWLHVQAEADSAQAPPGEVRWLRAVP